MNLIRYYNQNRKKIWRIIIIIFSALVLLQFVNYITKKEQERIVTGQDNNQTQNKTISSNATQLTTNQSVVTGENIQNSQLESATTTIDQFISYCNNKELEKAYELLTDECKSNLYKTLEVFEQAYYNNVFNGKDKICSIENWINNTYKVKIADNMLSTGKKNNSSKQDYITVKKETEGYKLNINNYIGNTNINKTTTKDDITMEVLSKDTYMEYEDYTINVVNNTENIILLDGKTNVNSLYLQDSKDNKYAWYSHEVTDPMLTINPKETKKITIRFYSSYISNKKTEKIVFSNLFLYYGDIGEIIEFVAEV